MLYDVGAFMADAADSENISNSLLATDDFQVFFDVQVLPKLLRNFNYEAGLEGAGLPDGKFLEVSLALPLDDPSCVSVKLFGVSEEGVRSQWFYGVILGLADSLLMPTGGAIAVSEVLTGLLERFFTSSCDEQVSEGTTEAPATPGLPEV